MLYTSLIFEKHIVFKTVKVGLTIYSTYITGI